MLVEVICTNFQECLIAEKLGADRIELCQELDEGGFTPDYQIIEECAKGVNIPVNVIVRHQNNSFIFNQNEFKQIKQDINFIKTTKANGIVVGFLNKKNEIDINHLLEIMRMKGNLQVTFHKAFDQINDFKNGLKRLSDLKVNNLLTQCGTQRIDSNVSPIKELINYAKEINSNTTILLGGGLNLSNLDKFAKLHDNLHLGSVLRIDKSWDNNFDLKIFEQIIGLLKQNDKSK